MNAPLFEALDPERAFRLYDEKQARALRGPVRMTPERAAAINREFERDGCPHLRMVPDGEAPARIEAPRLKMAPARPDASAAQTSWMDYPQFRLRPQED